MVAQGSSQDFAKAYNEAVTTIRTAVESFESATGRIARGLSLNMIEITNITSARPEYLRQVAIEVEPTPEEMAWQE